MLIRLVNKPPLPYAHLRKRNKRDLPVTRCRPSAIQNRMHSDWHPIPCMRMPCDEAAIRGGDVDVPCAAKSKPWILAATILASSMAFIDSTVVNVALPALQASFHATVVDVQWVVESYGLFLSALILAGGSLGDLFGRRRVFVAGVAIFAIASAGWGLATNIQLFIVPG